MDTTDVGPRNDEGTPRGFKRQCPMGLHLWGEWLQIRLWDNCSNGLIERVGVGEVVDGGDWDHRDLRKPAKCLGNKHDEWLQG